MEGECESAVVLQDSSQKLGSDAKLIGEKKRICEFGEENDEFSRKRVKMRDLKSLIRSDETSSHISKCSDEVQSSGDENSQACDASQATIAVKDSMRLNAKAVSQPLNLNSSVCIQDNSCVENSGKVQSHGKRGKLDENKCMNSRGIGFDLNKDVSSSVDVSQSSKRPNIIGRRDVSECGSSTVPLDNKDSLAVWKEMKQNSFLSSSHEGLSMQTRFFPSSVGGVPTPKKRGRKKGDVLKKRMELAKKEQVDRFAKIAAPSGLLNGLNPGIINHVRNRKQVHSIIEALVTSEKLENSESENKEVSHNEGAIKTFDRKKEEIRGDFGFNRDTHSSLSGLNNVHGIMNRTGYSVPMQKPFYSTAGENGGDGDACIVERVSNHDALELNLSSSVDKASENLSSLSLDEPANHASASILSMEAASVASQWLDLLQQDIKGRLQALRRSKKRVRAVITTELPFLMMKEFSCNENDPSVMKSCADGVSSKVNADVHKAKWSALFGQMDETLSEEERQLESWLNQVKEMRQHCEWSLQPDHVFHPQQIGAVRTDSSRSGKADNSEKELAVRAAAASIYSTCNFLSSMENIPCF